MVPHSTFLLSSILAMGCILVTNGYTLSSVQIVKETNHSDRQKAKPMIPLVPEFPKLSSRPGKNPGSNYQQQTQTFIPIQSVISALHNAANAAAAPATSQLPLHDSSEENSIEIHIDENEPEPLEEEPPQPQSPTQQFSYHSNASGDKGNGKDNGKDKGKDKGKVPLKPAVPPKPATPAAPPTVSGPEFQYPKPGAMMPARPQTLPQPQPQPEPELEMFEAEPEHEEPLHEVLDVEPELEAEKEQFPEPPLAVAPESGEAQGQGQSEAQVPSGMLTIMNSLAPGGSLAQASKPEKDVGPGTQSANAIGYATGDNATVTASVSNQMEVNAVSVIITESASASASSTANGTAFSQATLTSNGWTNQMNNQGGWGRK